MLRQVGAGAAMQGGGGEGGLLSLLKVWIGLEMRQFMNSSVKQMETLVKYDMLSPNI